MLVAARIPTGIRRLAGRLRRTGQSLGFRVWSALNGRAGHKTIRVYGSHRLCVDVADFRAYRIWRLGGSQESKVRLIAGLCAAHPGLFIDVGANYGEFSLMPATLGIECIAVEANPRVAACLRETFAGQSNISVVEGAAGSRAGTATFYFCDAATGSGSLARDIPAGEARNFSASTQAQAVRALTLDELVLNADPVRRHGLLLKIDVEGFEKDVLEGASHLIADAAWWRALLEFSPSCLHAAGKDVLEVWHYFRRYAGAVVSSVGPAPVALGELPETAPSDDVDLLIGAGALPERAGRP